MPRYRMTAEGATWANADFADGPKLAAWLKEHRLPIDSKNEADRRRNRDLSAFFRRLNRWEHGENPSIWTVDRFLTMLGFHLNDAPDDVWLRNVARVEALELLKSATDLTRTAIADRVGTSKERVDEWARELEDEAVAA